MVVFGYWYFSINNVPPYFCKSFILINIAIFYFSLLKKNKHRLCIFHNEILPVFSRCLNDFFWNHNCFFQSPFVGLSHLFFFNMLTLCCNKSNCSEEQCGFLAYFLTEQRAKTCISKFYFFSVIYCHRGLWLCRMSILCYVFLAEGE